MYIYPLSFLPLPPSLSLSLCLQYNRRMTICPALLARGMGSPLLIKPNPLSHIKSRHSITPVVTPDVITHRSGFIPLSFLLGAKNFKVRDTI